jgi:hypothetical protein
MEGLVLATWQQSLLASAHELGVVVWRIFCLRKSDKPDGVINTGFVDPL